jgi:hypothetical protein
VPTEPAGDHHPVALGEGLGQVLGQAAPHIDLKKLVSPSCHWLSCWTRWVTATRRLTTAMPL